MIDLYTWTTPNGRKVSIMLEETGLDYAVHAVDISKGQQFEPAFLAISPNNKIPAIVDHDSGLALMESGAILLYLAEKTGQFMPTEAAPRWRLMEWLMWQMGGLGPMLGQANHFLKFNPGMSEYAEERYLAEANRLYGVLERRLEGREFIVGDYSIADIAAWPWISRYEWHRVEITAYPNVSRWYKNIADRPAVRRGYDQPRKVCDIPLP
jgi:GST-like protein